MTVASSRNGVMGAEERYSARSGYDFAKKCLQRGESWKTCGHIYSAAKPRREPSALVAGDEAAYRDEMRISLSSSVILRPGWSRKNRISEEGSLEE